MLRSLDPEKNFSAPKSKAFHPTENERKKKFSADEIAYVEQATEHDVALQTKRAIDREERRLVTEKLVSEGKLSKEAVQRAGVA